MDSCNPVGDGVGKDGMGFEEGSEPAASCSRGKAVRPLRMRPMIKRESQRRIERSSSGLVWGAGDICRQW